MLYKNVYLLLYYRLDFQWSIYRFIFITVVWRSQHLFIKCLLFVLNLWNCIIVLRSLHRRHIPLRYMVISFKYIRYMCIKWNNIAFYLSVILRAYVLFKNMKSTFEIGKVKSTFSRKRIKKCFSISSRNLKCVKKCICHRDSILMYV